MVAGATEEEKANSASQAKRIEMLSDEEGLALSDKPSFEMTHKTGVRAMVAKHAAEGDWLAVPMTEDQKRVVRSKASDAARLAVAKCRG